jgi:3-hydroxybutyryl-CoA dehydratase
MPAPATVSSFPAPRRPFQSVADARVGMQHVVYRQLTPDFVLRAADLSEDYNSIHLDAEFAAKTRFKRTIVHGFSFVAVVSSILGMAFPGRGTVWIKEVTSFKKPVYVGSTLKFVATITAIFPERERMTIRTLVSIADESGRDIVVAENLSRVHLAPDPLRLVA